MTDIARELIIAERRGARNKGLEEAAKLVAAYESSRFILIEFRQEIADAILALKEA